MKTNTTLTTRRRLAVTLLSITGVGVLAACVPFPPIGPRLPDPTRPPVATSTDPEPPSLEGQIDPTAFDEGQRSIVIRANHTPDPQQPHRMELIRRRAYVRQSDTGPIKVEIFDEQSNPLGSWSAPRPGDIGAKSQEGRYALPYTKGLTYVRITDKQTGHSMETKVVEAVHNFCVANPTDIACDDVDLSADMTMETFGPRTLAVGQSVDVKLFARFKNNRLGTTSARAQVHLLAEPSNIVTFTTTDTTEVTLPNRIEGTYDTGWLPFTYKLTCNAPGTDRIFPEAIIYDHGFAHVIDGVVGNEHWNVWFDVTCT